MNNERAHVVFTLDTKTLRFHFCSGPLQLAADGSSRWFDLARFSDLFKTVEGTLQAQGIAHHGVDMEKLRKCGSCNDYRFTYSPLKQDNSQPMDIAKLHAEGRQFRTNEGQPVRILCTDRMDQLNGDKPRSVVALVSLNDGQDASFTFCNDGTRVGTGKRLELIPEERHGYVVLAQTVNGDDLEQGRIFASAEHARRMSRQDNPVVRKITWTI